MMPSPFLNRDEIARCGQKLYAQNICTEVKVAENNSENVLIFYLPTILLLSH